MVLYAIPKFIPPDIIINKSQNKYPILEKYNNLIFYKYFDIKIKTKQQIRIINAINDATEILNEVIPKTKEKIPVKSS